MKDINEKMQELSTEVGSYISQDKCISDQKILNALCQEIFLFSSIESFNDNSSSDIIESKDSLHL